MGAASRALTPLEVAVGRRRTALARLENVRVHAQAHGAAGIAPLETGIEEDPIETFLLRLRLDETRARHHHRLKCPRHFAPADDGCRRAQIFNAGIRARTNED